MKYAECNARQKKAFKNIFHASNWLLGGLENTMLDYPEGSEEYERASSLFMSSFCAASSLFVDSLF